MGIFEESTTMISPPEPFHPQADFSSLVHSVFILWNSTPNTTSSLHHLSKDLRALHTALSELEAQSENPLSLLQSRCLDRRPEYLLLKSRIEKVLSEIHSLLSTRGDLVESRINVLIGKLRLQVESVRAFVDSLGLSLLGRSSVVLSKVERVLMNAVFEERVGVRRERVLRAVREGGDVEAWDGVQECLIRGGIKWEDILRWEGEIRRLLVWVGENEIEVTRLREGAGLRVY